MNTLLASLAGQSFWGNTPKDIGMALLIFVAIMFGLRLVMNVITRTMSRYSSRTKTHVDDVLISLVQHISFGAYLVTALFLSSKFLVLPDIVQRTLFIALWIVLLFEGIRIIERFLICIIQYKWFRHQEGDAEGMMSIFALLARITLWTTGLLLLFSNIGINVTSLIASLGIGGIAIALALQNILGDLFSSFSLYFDQPFRVGDFVIVGDHKGTVKKIGLKTTRIQALQGEEIVIPNQELTTTRVRNFKRMEQRRVEFSFGITYETPQATVAAVPDLIKKVLTAEKDVQVERVHFKSFGESSLDFEVAYFVHSSDYIRYMDCQQNINLGIMRAFEDAKIAFAYPTRTVYLQK